MFDNILGNEENKITLKNSVEKGQVLHSYIFAGPSGVGKFLFAKEFAKAILCQGEDKPCKTCLSCVSFEGNNNPDITIIDEEEKSIKIETIRQMVKDVYEKPIKSLKKVYIINNSETMTKEAQNSLLKTLEDPPQYVVIILVTENDNLLLNTIKSRCFKIRFNRLDDNEVKSILEDQFEISKVSKTLLEIADGSIKKALMAHEKEDVFTEVKDAFSKIDKENLIDLLSKKDIIFKNKDNILEILNYINVVLLNKSKENIKYIEGIKIVEETKDRLKKNSNYDMSIDYLLLKLWEEING